MLDYYYGSAPPPRPPPPPPVMLNTKCIDALNSRADLDFFTEYNKEYLDPEVDDDPFFGINVSSKFYDVDSLSATEFIKNTPVRHVTGNDQDYLRKIPRVVVQKSALL